MMILLSPHFTVQELIASEVAIRKGIDNTPPAEVLENLRLLAEALERVRSVLGSPLRINSGYRCPKLNSSIGGSKTSAHLQGLAADFTCPGFGTPEHIMRELVKHKDKLGYDQLIYEGTWIHFGLPEEGYPKGQNLVAKFSNGGVTYERFT